MSIILLGVLALVGGILLMSKLNSPKENEPKTVENTDTTEYFKSSLEEIEKLKKTPTKINIEDLKKQHKLSSSEEAELKKFLKGL